MSIASKVQEKGFKVSIVDEVLLQASGDALEDHLDNVSIVGITGHITQHNIMLQIAERLKNHDQGIKVVFGGPHVTLTKDILLKDPHVEFLIQGEGEIPFTQLIESLNDNKPIENIDGLIFKKNGKIRINPPKVIKNLNNLPIPAFELSKLDTYYNLFMEKYDKMASLLFPRSYRIPLESSRGCPVACNFCCAKSTLGLGWRPKSPERLIQEITKVEETFPKIFHADDTYITFVDNNFTTSKKRVREFCELKRKSKYDINWAALSRATDLNYDLLKIMVTSGFFAIYIGGESGNIDSLISMGKKYKEDSTIAAVQACIKANVQRIVVSFIIGLPTEAIPAIKNTLRYAYNLRELAPEKVIISIYKATPYPSTSFWEAMEKEGRLSPDLEKYDLALPKGLVFDHPIFGYEAVEIDKIIDLWNRLTAMKYFKEKFMNKVLSLTNFSKFINKLLRDLKRMGFDQIPEKATLSTLTQTQIIDLTSDLVKKLEKIVLYSN